MSYKCKKRPVKKVRSHTPLFEVGVSKVVIKGKPAHPFIPTYYKVQDNVRYYGLEENDIVTWYDESSLALYKAKETFYMWTSDEGETLGVLADEFGLTATGEINFCLSDIDTTYFKVEGTGTRLPVGETYYKTRTEILAPVQTSNEDDYEGADDGDDQEEYIRTSSRGL